MSKRSCTIIIPTFNRADLLRSALKSVGELRIPEGWQVDLLVVDNRSTDGTREVVESFAREAAIETRRVEEPRQGLNHARNRGLLSSSSEWVAYLDDDMLVVPGWLEAFAEAVESHSPGALTGKVEPWFEEPPPEWLTPRVLRSVTSAYSLKGERTYRMPANRGHELPGCNFAVRRRLALDLGGFHPSLDRAGGGMLAGGDFELGQKLVLAKAAIFYVPGCSIRHFISKHKISVEGLSRRWYGLGATSRVLSELNGAGPTARKRLRLLLRFGRQCGASRIYSTLGRRSQAVESRLLADRTAGFLWGGSRIGPRAWPPEPLA